MAHLKQIREKQNQYTSFSGILIKETYSSEASVLQETYCLKCQTSEYKFIHMSEKTLCTLPPAQSFESML